MSKPRHASSQQPPEWADEDPGTGRKFKRVPNPDVAASRQQRAARRWLLAVLMVVPLGLGSCVMTVIAVSRAGSASQIAAQALAAVQERERAEVAQSTVEALAAVQRRLSDSGHRLSSAALVPAQFSIIDIGGEDHAVGIVSQGVHLLTAHAVLDADSRLMGVTFVPGSAVVTGGGETCEVPYTTASAPEDLRLRAIVYHTESTPADLVPVAPSSIDLVPVPKLEEWLLAWLADDQEQLREIGNYTTSDPVPWFGAHGWRYVPDTARVVSVFEAQELGEARLFAHIQFALCDGSPGGTLVQDLEVVARRDGELLRILTGDQIGNPVATGS